MSAEVPCSFCCCGALTAILSEFVLVESPVFVEPPDASYRPFFVTQEGCVGEKSQGLTAFLCAERVVLGAQPSLFLSSRRLRLTPKVGHPFLRRRHKGSSFDKSYLCSHPVARPPFISLQS
jgi:hypothetical protein